MTEWSDGDLAALRRLIIKAETDPEFSKDDILSLKLMADAFKGFRYFGRFAKWLIFLLAGLAGAITAWEQVSEKARQWLIM